MEVDVRTTVENQLAVFALSREKALNSLTHDMIKRIHRHAEASAKSEDIAFLFFPLLQQKVYCAGGDIRWLYQQGKSGHHEYQMAFFADEYRLDYAIGTSDKPVIAIVDGFLIGGGMGLIMPAKTIYATENASFAMPETSIGFFPDVGMSYQLSQCPGHTGMYLALTGQRFNAQEAYYLGLVEGVLSEEDAHRIQTFAIDNKDDRYLHETVIQMLSESGKIQEECPIANHRQQIDDVFSAATVQDIMERLRHMQGAWAEQTLKQMENACPLSLCVTFNLLTKVKSHNQAFSYQLDYAIAYHFMRSHDFYEGVRAQIIEKDRNPQWQYSHVREVPPSVVDAFFMMEEIPLDLAYHANCSESEIITDN